MQYRIASANEYVVVTGNGVENLKITKKALVWPFQKSSVISIQRTYPSPAKLDLCFSFPNKWTQPSTSRLFCKL